MTEVPSAWVCVVLTLCAARAVHLVLWDSIIGTHPDSGTDLSGRLERWLLPDGPVVWWRDKTYTLATCPRCLGFWISLLTVCVYGWVWPWQLGGAGAVTWFAVWAAQCVLSHFDYRYLVD